MATFVEELLARLSLDVDEPSFRDGERGLSEIAKGAAAMGAAVTAAVTAAQVALVGIVTTYGQTAKEFTNLSGVANENMEVFQGYAAAAKSVGIEHDKLADILKDVNDKAGDFLQTGGGPMADFFENIAPKVGITAEMFRGLSGKDALQLYVDGLEAANLSQAEMTFYMEAIANDATLLLPLLKNGGKGFNEMAREAQLSGAIISESGALSAKQMTDAFGKLQLWITGIRNDIAEALVPAVTELIEGTRAFIKENRALISSSITNFFKAATVALKGLVYFVGLFAAYKLGLAAMAVARGVMVMTTAFKAARIGALLMNAAVMALPLLIGLAIAAVLLLAEDVYSFFQGGESYLGDFLKQWPFLGEAVDSVTSAFNSMVDSVKRVWEWITKLFTFDFAALKQSISDAIPDWLKSGASTVYGAITAEGASPTPYVASAGLMAPGTVGAAVSNSTSNRSVVDNRQYNISGADIGEVKRVLNERNAYAAKTLDTGREY